MPAILRRPREPTVDSFDEWFCQFDRKFRRVNEDSLLALTRRLQRSFGIEFESGPDPRALLMACLDPELRRQHDYLRTLFQLCFFIRGFDVDCFLSVVRIFSRDHNSEQDVLFNKMFDFRFEREPLDYILAVTREQFLLLVEYNDKTRNILYYIDCYTGSIDCEPERLSLFFTTLVERLLGVATQRERRLDLLVEVFTLFMEFEADEEGGQQDRFQRIDKVLALDVTQLEVLVGEALRFSLDEFDFFVFFDEQLDEVCQVNQVPATLTALRSGSPVHTGQGDEEAGERLGDEGEVLGQRMQGMPI